MLELSDQSTARLALFSALTVALVGCQDIRDARSNDKGSTASKGPDRGDELDDGATVSAEQLADLFRDDVAFSVPELTGGRTNCEDVVSRPDIAADVVPWPKELKRFLVEQLKLMPIKGQVIESVFAIYLVDEAVLNSGGGTPAAGLACDRGTDYKGIIFLNADTFIKGRKDKGIGTWQELRSVQERFVLLESGDNAALTLIHEVLHAIDNKLYVNGLDGAIKQRRAEVFDLSWSDHTEPKYERISMMALTGATGGDLNSGCRTRPRGVAPPQAPLGLTAASGEALAGELRYLADETNFVVPYAMVTAAEDFAESLTLYYYGAYRDSWQTRTVYKNDIGDQGIDGNAVLYVHKTKDILRRSTLQRDKMCQMAELVFASCKL